MNSKSATKWWEKTERKMRTMSKQVSYTSDPLCLSCQVWGKNHTHIWVDLLWISTNRQTKKTKKQKRIQKFTLWKIWDRKELLSINFCTSSIWRHGFLNAPNHNAKTTTIFQSFNSSSVCMSMPLEKIVRLKNRPSCLIWHLNKVMMVKGPQWVYYQWKIIKPSTQVRE